MPVLDKDVLAFRIAELTQPLPEGSPRGGSSRRRGLPDHPDAGKSTRGLCFRARWTNQGCENEREDNHDSGRLQDAGAPPTPSTHSHPHQRCVDLSVRRTLSIPNCVTRRTERASQYNDGGPLERRSERLCTTNTCGRRGNFSSLIT